MANPLPDYLQNPTNPLYLHPSESPAQILVSPPLSGANYHAWSRGMRMALLSKNKLGFVDGSIPALTAEDPDFGTWERCNTMVLSWIVRSISTEIARSVLWIDKAYDVWADLKERFSQQDIYRVSDLMEEIYSYKQGELSVSAYFTGFKVLWEELENFQPIPSCSCVVPCTCGLLDTIKKYRQTEKVTRFLKGLNENFSYVRSQIMLIDPLPSLNKVFSLVIQQERQMSGGLSVTEDSKIVANIVNSSNPNARRQFGRGSAGRGFGRGTASGKVCTYCGKLGHTVDTCYRKHGFPPGFKFRNSGPMLTNTSVVNNAVADEPACSNESAPAGSQHESSFSFTREQYNSLLALIQQSQPVSHNSNQIGSVLSISANPDNSGQEYTEDDWFC